MYNASTYYSMNSEKTATIDATLSPSRKTNKGKKYKAVPTPKQRETARLVIETAKGKTKFKSNAELVAQAGYGIGIQTSPHRVLNSDGVKIALEDYGFHPDTAKNVVHSILTSKKAKDADRLKASDMVFKVHGTYAEQRSVNVNVEIDANNPRLLELAERLRGTV